MRSRYRSLTHTRPNMLTSRLRTATARQAIPFQACVWRLPVTAVTILINISLQRGACLARLLALLPLPFSKRED